MNRLLCAIVRVTLGLALVSLSSVSPAARAQSPASSPGIVRIALVSDPHVTRDPAKAAYGEHFDAVIASVNAAAPDFVLIAGDLTDGGRPEQLDDFRKKIAGFKAPVRFVPGNHDIGDKHLESKPGAGVNEKRIALFEQKLGPTFWAGTMAGVRVIGIDTPLLGSGLPQEAEQWRFLEHELDTAVGGPPVVIVEHYPLFVKTAEEVGGGYWNIEPAPRQRFLDLLSKTKANVRVFLSAHLHRPLDLTWNGLRFIGTPPVSFGIPTGKQPEGWTLVTIPASGPIETRFTAVAHMPSEANRQTTSRTSSQTTKTTIVSSINTVTDPSPAAAK